MTTIIATALKALKDNCIVVCGDIETIVPDFSPIFFICIRTKEHVLIRTHTHARLQYVSGVAYSVSLHLFLFCWIYLRLWMLLKIECRDCGQCYNWKGKKEPAQAEKHPHTSIVWGEYCEWDWVQQWHAAKSQNAIFWWADDMLTNQLILFFPLSIIVSRKSSSRNRTMDALKHANPIQCDVSHHFEISCHDQPWFRKQHRSHIFTFTNRYK